MKFKDIPPDFISPENIIDRSKGGTQQKERGGTFKEEVEDWKDFYFSSFGSKALYPKVFSGNKAKKIAQETISKIDKLNIPLEEKNYKKIAVFPPYIDLEQTLSNPNFKDKLILPKEFKGSLFWISSILASGTSEEPDRYNVRSSPKEPYVFRAGTWKNKFENFFDLQKQLSNEQKNKIKAIPQATNFLESLLIALKESKDEKLNKKEKNNFAIYCAGTIFDPKNNPRIPLIIKREDKIEITLENIVEEIENINKHLLNDIPQGVEVLKVLIENQ